MLPFCLRAHTRGRHAFRAKLQSAAQYAFGTRQAAARLTRAVGRSSSDEERRARAPPPDPLAQRRGRVAAVGQLGVDAAERQRRRQLR